MTNTLYGVNLVRSTTEPAAFWSKLSGVLTCKHMDDGALVGPDDLTDPTTATTVALLDAITVLSRKISELEINPAVDPLDSTSRMLDVSIVGQRNYDVARNTPKFLQDHKSLQDIIVILGVDELSEKDKLTIARDCKVHRFLSQPFFVAEVFTGTPESAWTW